MNFSVSKWIGAVHERYMAIQSDSLFYSYEDCRDLGMQCFANLVPFLFVLYISFFYKIRTPPHWCKWWANHQAYHKLRAKKRMVGSSIGSVHWSESCLSYSHPLIICINDTAPLWTFESWMSSRPTYITCNIHGVRSFGNTPSVYACSLSLLLLLVV